MKTRFSSLVSLKKNIVQKSEQLVQNANKVLRNAEKALEISLEELHKIPSVEHGLIAEFLATRMLLESQRALIQHNQEWVAYAQKELLHVKEQLKYDMIEYEKFKYLELQEMQKVIKAQKIKEAKDLDEIALMTFEKKTDKVREAS